MKIHLCWVLLAVSLVGNLFFIGGYFHANQLAGELQRSPKARMERLSEHLKLDDTTKQGLLEVRDALIAAGTEFAGSREQLMGGFWGQLDDREIDRQRLKSQLVQLGELELAHRLQVVDQVASFLELLNPDQQDRLLNLLDRRNLFNYLDNHSLGKKRAGG